MEVIGTNIAKALLAAQRQIEGVSKDSTNPHYNSKFADLTAVIDATIPILNKHGIVVIQAPVSPTYEGHLALNTTLLHESGELISGVAVVPLSKQDPQAYGSAMTYARRYSLASIIGLKTLDDDAETAVRGPANAGTVRQPAQVFKPTGGFPKAAPPQEQAKATPRGKTSLFPKVGARKAAPVNDQSDNAGGEELGNDDIPF